MIHKSFYKREARVENYYQPNCYASREPKTKKQKYYPISQTLCGYLVYNDLAPDAVRYWGNLFETGKVWSI